jgi:hypothetical protein
MVSEWYCFLLGPLNSGNMSSLDIKRSNLQGRGTNKGIDIGDVEVTIGVINILRICTRLETRILNSVISHIFYVYIQEAR